MQSKLRTFRMALVLMMSLIVGTISAQTVNGNVVDETGEPVIGATVLEKGTKNAVITDFSPSRRRVAKCSPSPTLVWFPRMLTSLARPMSMLF